MVKNRSKETGKGKNSPRPEKKDNSSSVTKNAVKYKWVLVIVIALATFFTYFPSLQNGFVDNDDDKSVYANDLVKSFSINDISDVFSTYLIGNYVPLVSLSFILDYQAYGLNTFGYHLTGLILHCISVILIFFFFFRLSKDVWVGAIVALLFGIHPMHVESVSWVSERKDQLYLLFYVSAMLAYLSYLQKRKLLWIALTGFFFILSLLSKGQAVTLPLILLLIDYYVGRKINTKVILEKIPFFIVSIVFGVIAFFAQKSEGYIGYTHISFFDRIIFASYALLSYLYKLVLPIHLSFYYPYPPKVGGGYPVLFYLSPLIVVALIGLIVWKFRKNKLILFGVLFFFTNVILILQFLPVGDAITADRYTYLPYTGLFFIVAMFIVNYFKKNGNNFFTKLKPVVALVLCAYLIFLVDTTYARTKVWQNSQTLWTDILNKEPLCWRAYNHLAHMYVDEKKYDSALIYFNGAVSVMHISLTSYAHEEDSNYVFAFTHLDRGATYAQSGKEKINSAISDFKMAVKYQPQWYVPCQDLAVLYRNTGQVDKAIRAFRQCLKDKIPDSTNTYNDLFNEYTLKGETDSAAMYKLAQ